MALISVVTTVYNRANLLLRLYNSLNQQTSKNFKWIIIDDGSTDNFKYVVSKFVSDFEICVISQKNAGKCAALNKAYEVCDTELLFVVDSDDYLENTAIQLLENCWNKIFDRRELVGIVAYKTDIRGQLSGKVFPEGRNELTLNELNYKYMHKGETTLIHRTCVLKENMHKIFEDEIFLSEEIQYNQIDNVGCLYLLRESITIMEYQENGLTSNYIENWIKNPKGTKLLLKSKYNTKIGLNFVEICLKQMKTCIQYGVLMCKSNKFSLSDSPNSIFTFVLIPISYILSKFKFS